MPKTLDNGPWDYLPVLNECIKIMITIAIGVIASRCKALEAETFVPQAVKFVFTVSRCTFNTLSFLFGSAPPPPLMLN
jgi:hypothetical protein